MENRINRGSIPEVKLLKQKNYFSKLAAAIGVPLALIAINIACSDTKYNDLPTPTAAIESSDVVTMDKIKDQVLSFSWEDVENEDKLQAFTSLLANGYIQSTKTNRVSKQDLIGKDKTTFYPNQQKFIEAIRQVNPTFTTSPDQWGYADYESEKVFIDLGSLKQQNQEESKEISAGMALLDGLWHEWGHLDVTERTTGELIGNVEKSYFILPNTNIREPFRKYRGGTVYTDTYFGFLRFEEVWLETITVRRMLEEVGLSAVSSGRNYFENGVNFFPKLTSALGISLEELYQMHATSDFEGLARLIGSHLPGFEGADPLYKGKALFVGIHENNPEIIEQTGVLELLKNK